jgi:uncharacterized lipoprotein YehR (DUF1307 family)
MKRAAKWASVVCAVVISLSLTACGDDAAAPSVAPNTGGTVKPEHTQGEHPSAEHPKGTDQKKSEHPKSEHPRGEHPR